MRDHLVLAGMMIGVFAGCSVFGGAVTEDNFFEQLAKESCKKLEKCEKGYFDSEYDNVDDCVDEFLDYADDYIDYLEDCDFDDGNGGDCVDAYRQVDCADWYDGDAYDDCDFEDIYDCE